MSNIIKTQKQLAGAESFLPVTKEVGTQYICTDSGKFFIYDSSRTPRQISVAGGADVLQDRVICNQDNKDTTLGGVIDSSKEYFIDGVIDMGSTQITVPIGGINVRGYSFDLSALVSTNDNYTLFASETPVIGSGTVILNDFTISINGSASQVYSLVDVDGSHGVSFTNIYYIGCTSLGELASFRIGSEANTLRVGGSPSLTFSGDWGGYRASSTIARDLAGTMSAPLFKEGVAFQMDGRFLTDINADLPTLAPLCDFTTGSFSQPSTLQFKDAIITRDGSFNANDSNIFTNLSASDLICDWNDNVGMRNTFVGGGLIFAIEQATSIPVKDISVDIAGTLVPISLEHFDSPSSDELRHLGITPIEFTVSWNFVLDGTANNTYEIFLVKLENGSNPQVVFSQTRVCNNLQGGAQARDVAYFNGQIPIVLNQNDSVVWQVANLTDGNGCTMERDSAWYIKER